MTENKNQILVVDDHPAVRETMNEVLVEEGFETKLAKDGEEALSLCSEYAFDFILIDIQMPGMNGVEVLKKLKSSGKHTPKFIFFTAYSTPELEESAKSLGAFAFLKKPIKVEKIINLLKPTRNSSILIHLENQTLLERVLTVLEGESFKLTKVSGHDQALMQLRQIDYSCIIYDGDSPSIEQEAILRTIKTINSDTICIETNEDEKPETLLKEINFRLNLTTQIQN